MNNIKAILSILLVILSLIILDGTVVCLNLHGHGILGVMVLFGYIGCIHLIIKHFVKRRNEL